MVIMTEWGLGCSRVLSLVLGRLTWTPVWIIGAVTMKITSRTSITSTRGVTLISEREDWVRPRWFVKAIEPAVPEKAAGVNPQLLVQPNESRVQLPKLRV